MGGVTYRIRLVESDPEAYDQFYNVVANPLLWFIQHYLWDLSNAPDIRRNEVDAFEHGYRAVNDDLARAVLEEVDGQDAVVMLHDYHLYIAPRAIRHANPDAFLHHFVHIPWTQPDAWRVLPRDMREEIYEGVLSNDIVGFHTRAYKRNFMLCCRELFDMDVDEEAGIVRFEGREVWVRAYPLPISAESFQRTAGSPEVARVRAGAAAPPARAPDPARRPRGPVQERAARLHRLRPLPHPAPGVPREGHLHRPAHALAPGRARVRSSTSRRSRRWSPS